MVIKDKLKSLLRLSLPIILGIALIWWLYRDVKLADIELMFSQMDHGIFLLSLLFGLIANTIRGLRWHILLHPLAKRAGIRIKPSNAIATVLGSYSVNMAIPRAGELWRCVAYRKYERLSLAELIGTLITDRIADVVCLAIILLAVILSYSEFFISYLFSGYDYQQILLQLAKSPVTYIVIGTSLTTLWAVWYLYRHRPDSRLTRLIQSVWLGIGSIRSMEHPVRFLIYSIAIWLGYFSFFYTSFLAFDFTARLPVSAGLIAFAMSSLAVLAPVQNGMGAWHFMVITTLVAYGIGESDAKGFALIVHTLQSLWITLIGVVAIFALPFINKNLSNR